MKSRTKTANLILLIFIVAACGGKKEIPKLLEENYHTYTVSFDKKQPEANLEKDNLKSILILLHHRFKPSEIKQHFGLSDSIWSEQMNFLFGEGLIKKFEDSSFIPTFLILDEENGKQLKKFTDSLGKEMSGIAIDRLSKIKEAYSKIPSLKNIPFDYSSMFILGAVLHDGVQLKNYQDRFIKSFVPHRGDNHYYLLLMETGNEENMNPKIFETRYYEYPSFTLGSFSSSAYERNIATYATSELVNDFGKSVTESDSIYQITLLNELVKMNRNDGYLPPKNIVSGFERNGVIVKGKSTVPVISKIDQQKIAELGALIEPDIINYFENRQTLFVKWYLNSQYREETSYKEWMIWVYKMIAAKTIDVLIEKSYIKTFGGNTASFILEK
jgi:hypothetical protein